MSGSSPPVSSCYFFSIHSISIRSKRLKILPIFMLVMILFICTAYATGPVITRRTKNSLTFLFDGAESQHVLVFKHEKLARIDEYYENGKTSSISITYTNDQITSIKNTVFHEDFKHNSFEYCDLSYDQHTMNYRTWNEDGTPKQYEVSIPQNDHGNRLISQLNGYTVEEMVYHLELYTCAQFKTLTIVITAFPAGEKKAEADHEGEYALKTGKTGLFTQSDKDPDCFTVCIMNADGAPVHSGYLLNTITPTFNFKGILFVPDGKKPGPKDQ